MVDWRQKHYPTVVKTEEIIMNCKLVPRNIIDSEEDIYCSEDLEYNTAKYIDMFNKRITPLLVCFNRSIRSEILINNPNDRKYFTNEQCVLVSGEPNKLSDQDTYEQLMTMEDKEIRFWTKYGMVPPFLDDCGMGKWEDIVQDYEERQERDRKLGIDKERETINEIINGMSVQNINDFLEDGVIPPSILKIAELNPVKFSLMSKKYPEIELISLNDIIEQVENKKMFENEAA